MGILSDFAADNSAPVIELPLQVGKAHGLLRQVSEDRGFPFATRHRQSNVYTALVLFIPIDHQVCC